MARNSASRAEGPATVPPALLSRSFWTRVARDSELSRRNGTYVRTRGLKIARLVCALSGAVCALALCGCSGSNDSSVPPGEASAEYEFLGDVTKVVSVYHHSGTVVCESEVDANWVVVLRVRRIIRGRPPVQEDGTLALRIHSPTETFDTGVFTLGTSYKVHVLFDRTSLSGVPLYEIDVVEELPWWKRLWIWIYFR